MEFSIAEMFLLCWSVSATIAFVYFNQMFRKAMRGGVILCVIISDIAEGKATVKKTADGRITITREDDGTEFVLKEVD